MRSLTTHKDIDMLKVMKAMKARFTTATIVLLAHTCPDRCTRERELQKPHRTGNADLEDSRETHTRKEKRTGETQTEEEHEDPAEEDRTL